VTSANDYAARNFGLERLPPHGDRYAKAREFFSVVDALWDTWEDGAWVYDRKTSLSFHPRSSMRSITRANISPCRAALNIERSPQASGNHPGRRLGHRQGFCRRGRRGVFGSSATLPKAKEYYGPQAAHGQVRPPSG